MPEREHHLTNHCVEWNSSSDPATNHNLLSYFNKEQIAELKGGWNYDTPHYAVFVSF
jgi:hypothetical protein